MKYIIDIDEIVTGINCGKYGLSEALQEVSLSAGDWITNEFDDEFNDVIARIEKERGVNLLQTIKTSDETSKHELIYRSYEDTYSNQAYELALNALEEMDNFKCFLDSEGKKCAFYEAESIEFNITIKDMIESGIDEPAREDLECYGETKGEKMLEWYLDEYSHVLDNTDIFGYNDCRLDCLDIEENLYYLMLDYALPEYNYNKKEYYSKLKKLIKNRVSILKRAIALEPYKRLIGV